MAFKIIWSPEAIGDLGALTAFIAQDNPSAAERTGLEIIRKTRHLERHPMMGRMVPECRDPLVRELIEPPYRIVYHVKKRERLAEILRIWHGARGAPELPPDPQDWR